MIYSGEKFVVNDKPYGFLHGHDSMIYTLLTKDALFASFCKKILSSK